MRKSHIWNIWLRNAGRITGALQERVCNKAVLLGEGFYKKLYWFNFK